MGRVFGDRRIAFVREQVREAGPEIVDVDARADPCIAR
jgi:hypothetical protein